MYCEFIFILIDYFSSINKRISIYEWGMPIVLSVIIGWSAIHYDNIDLPYEVIKELIIFLTTLLGFTLAALTLFLTGRVEKTKTYVTNKMIRGKKISLYRLTIISYSYIIIVEAFLCLGFYASNALGIAVNPHIALFVNCCFIVLTFNVLLATIRTITDLYLIITKE